MKLIKYEHACLILEKEANKLIIDPGCFSNLPKDLSGVKCLVITEEHVDHYHLPNVKLILTQSPDVEIYTTKAVHDELSKEAIKSTAIEGQKVIKATDYTLSFYETDHAPVHEKSPCKSLAVKVDDCLYYPSDSFKTIGDPIEVLALPTSGPWHKLTEAIDFANAIKSKTILTTHNGLYNADGHGVANHFIESNLADSSRKYVHLEPGQSIEV